MSNRFPVCQKSFEKIKSQEDLENYFKEFYPDSIELMPDYQKEYFENPQGMLATLRCYPWAYQNSVALLGDAAHAIVPFFGQGMNSGFEDCYYLFKFYDETKDWESCLDKYQKFQKPNGDAIANLAIENFTIMSDRVGDEKFLFKKAVEKRIEKEFPELYRARYGMVTYTLIPYDLVWKVGFIQDEILEELCEGIEEVEQVDLKKAKELIDQKYLPFVKENSIDITRFQE